MDQQRPDLYPENLEDGESVRVERQETDSFLHEVLPAMALFAAIYIATFVICGWMLGPEDQRVWQWIAVLSVSLATYGSVRFSEHGTWTLGFAPRSAIHVLTGATFATTIIVTAELLIAATTRFERSRGSGPEPLEIFALFLPAALHEELLFRGYPFQKLLRWRAAGALFFSSVPFTLLHLNNPSVGWVATVNIFLAGLLFAFAFLATRTLWFTVGMHFWWNVFSGPVLGHEVSGYVPIGSVFKTLDSGPVHLTGGTFGNEGSLWMTLAEVIGGLGLLWWIRRRRNANAERAVRNRRAAETNAPA